MGVVSNSKTIAKNTIFLYVRMLIVVAVNIYAARLILSILGITDKGIYDVVGGVVAMFGFLNTSLSGATSRFLTVEIGRQDNNQLKRVFSSALLIHIIIALAIVILGESVGLWLLSDKLVIPADRLHAANIVYQLSILAVIISVTQVPYSASIIAHERMGVFAYMGILDAAFKLAICFLLECIHFDKLVAYAALVLFSSFVQQIVSRIYCIRKFPECKFNIHNSLNKEITKPMLSFAGWDLFGNFSVMARTQGVAIVMNTFFGPAINAAIGFSATIGTTILGFSHNFLTAIRPPIVKAYSSGDIHAMQGLINNATKYSFALLLLLSAPFIFESSFIIKLWLETPPVYTDIFCVLELVLSLLSTMFLPVMFAIHATGKIRRMSIANGIILLLIIPISYILLKLGFSPTVSYLTKISLQFFVIGSNLMILKKNIPEFNLPQYVSKAIVPSVVTMFIVVGGGFIVRHVFNESGAFRFICVSFTTSILCIICTYFILMDKGSRAKVLSFIKSKLPIHYGTTC